MIDPAVAQRGEVMPFVAAATSAGAAAATSEGAAIAAAPPAAEVRKAPREGDMATTSRLMKGRAKMRTSSPGSPGKLLPEQRCSAFCRAWLARMLG
ncbi:hypothetical protein WPS_17090 [Vulcanimicrobium alpinum]|uniref:Uncharacterized protein n=1 Tax=Vulcanimicrobium alpinum TaxID=3016050 RepID=A0AAN2C9Y2_UNVUL|nr:hypothetical protein [Vulcanimicrobium alpinum]BDE06433.1 hypothetical protein WPS_17090 [Vulcanimicrobium alpinum]